MEKTERLMSLDALRGFDMFFNTGESAQIAGIWAVKQTPPRIVRPYTVGSWIYVDCRQRGEKDENTVCDRCGLCGGGNRKRL